MNETYCNEVKDLWILINENIYRIRQINGKIKYIENEVNDWCMKMFRERSEWLGTENVFSMELFLENMS